MSGNNELVQLFTGEQMEDLAELRDLMDCIEFAVVERVLSSRSLKQIMQDLSDCFSAQEIEGVYGTCLIATFSYDRAAHEQGELYISHVFIEAVLRRSLKDLDFDNTTGRILADKVIRVSRLIRTKAEEGIESEPTGTIYKMG